MRSACPLCLLLIFGLTVRARGQSRQVLPEIDTYLALILCCGRAFRPSRRERAEILSRRKLASIEFYRKPWFKLQNATIFDLDEAKKRFLVFSTGYRVLLSPMLRSPIAGS